MDHGEIILMNSGFLGDKTGFRDRIQLRELKEVDHLSDEDIQLLKLEFKDIQSARRRSSSRVIDTFLKYFAGRSNSVH